MVRVPCNVRGDKGNVLVISEGVPSWESSQPSQIDSRSCRVIFTPYSFTKKKKELYYPVPMRPLCHIVVNLLTGSLVANFVALRFTNYSCKAEIKCIFLLTLSRT